MALKGAILNMKEMYTIPERLEDLRKERGLTMEQLAEMTGISRSTIGSYEAEEDKDINHRNLVTLAKFYDVSVDYLLCLTENRKHPNTDLSELHLSDEMVGLLKTGRVNNRLLCEIAVHEDFVKLMADIEIYVDGIAAMQIQNVNALVDIAQAEILEKYQPKLGDKTVNSLGVAHVNEDEYFSHRIHEDIDKIIDTIKDVHRSDSDSAPETSIAKELKRNVEEIMSFKGSEVERFLITFCKQVQIPYKKLSEAEKQYLIRIAQKSRFVSRKKRKGKHYK